MASPTAALEAETWRVWSPNPAKAWTEKFFIAWAFCFWIPMMVVIVWTGETALCGIW
jgi:hypothetical protein